MIITKFFFKLLMLYCDYKIKELYILLHKPSTYVKSYDGQTKWLYFFIEDNNLLENFNSIWHKISIDI